MKKTLFVVVAVACAASVVAQDVPKDTSYWKKSGSSSLTFGQTSFTNWAAGGNNSVSVLASFAGKLGYEKDPWMWDNSIVGDKYLLSAYSTTFCRPNAAF